MNKASDRSKKMRAMFGGVDPSELVKDPAPAQAGLGSSKRVSAGAIKSMRNTFSNVEKENEELRKLLEEGDMARELDTELLEPSFVADRMVVEVDADFEALKQSIEANGQQVPILARPHPTSEGRYQIAFGHRRWRACHELGRPVRGIIKPLSDEELLIAQGQENHERKNLSFIETALFASRLAADYPQTIISKAIGKDATTVSKLLRLMGQLPQEFVRKVGPAPRIGRPRWEELASHFHEGALPAGVNGPIEVLMESEEYKRSSSDERFMMIFEEVGQLVNQAPSPAVVSVADAKAAAATASSEKAWLGNKRVLMKAKGATLSFQVDTRKQPDLAAFLKERLPELLEEFEARKQTEDAS
ncbi:plasmid partitioning protein RepB [Pseudovibrio sp. SPO723]|uniref:plasmid partitioning protein RepB n=1 Tax=Nesiotobacter zosterae TaxID=392721 RepID=UPI0029C1DA4A|nr:plasmid partitioning protein RepB [Pseudovibrio sp. SPO723]MDX5593431.1 plasmid partitioning protein RepB [Pseudovibrio sp. SPO723]